MTTIEAHVEALGTVLRGPARVRRDMLRELHDGLTDTARAHTDRGLDQDAAGRAAVAEFGTVAELAPAYQDELTAHQGRTGAALVAVLFAATVLGWDVLWTSGVDWGPVPDAAGSGALRALSRAEDLVAAGTAALAAVVLGLTFVRRVPPRLLAGLTGVVAAGGAIGVGGLVIAMHVAGGQDVGRLVTENATILPAYVLSCAAMLAVVVTATRSLRLAVGRPGPRGRAHRPAR